MFTYKAISSFLFGCHVGRQIGFQGVRLTRKNGTRIFLNGFHTSLQKQSGSLKMVKAKQFLYAKPFEGEVTRDNFNLVEEQLPELEEGEALFEAVFFSVDPYMRAYMRTSPTGVTMIGSQVAKVIDSKNSKYQKGSLWVLYCGWRSHFIFNPTKKYEMPLYQPPMAVPDLGSIPPSVALGAVGMPGITAYFGLLDLCQPKPGETVVISGAAGAVGSLVGQIAKIKGCKVIGFAGAEDKIKWLVDELGFDYAFNYKTRDLKECLQEAAPNGVDCYFDNVGGMMSQTVMEQMNLFGRIAVCGAISTYNDKTVTMVPTVQPLLVMKQLRMEGFVVTRWYDRTMEASEQMSKWIQEGKIQFRETVMEGFDNLPNALMGIMKGDNIGKMVLKV